MEFGARPGVTPECLPDDAPRHVLVSRGDYSLISAEREHRRRL